MATLEGQSIASSYEQLLHVDRDGGGNTTTLVDVKDGDNGTTFALQLSTTTAVIDNPTTSSASQGGILRLQSDDGAALGTDHRLGVIEFSAAEDASNNIITGARIEALNSHSGAWDASNNDTDLLFYTTTDNASQSEVMRLTAEKNVGIGTSIPAEQFHLSGPAGAGTLFITNETAISDGEELGAIYFGGNNGGGTYDHGALILALAAQSDWTVGSKAGTDLLFKTCAINSTSLSTRMAIDSSGNVGIGTATPTTQASVNTFLEIDGGANRSGLALNGYNSSSRWEIVADEGDDLFFARGGTTKVIMTAQTNVGIGTTSFPTNLAGGLTIANGTAPSAGLANTASLHVASGEMYVSDASDNESVLSPHKFELFDKPDDMAWSYHSKNRTHKKKINVDMWSAFKQLEELSGKQFVFQEEWNPPQRQKTITKEVEEEVTRTEVVLVDGKYIEKTITETITKESEELVFDEFPLYDEDGEPIMILVSEAVEAEEGVEAVEAVYEPKIHRVPVYE